MTDVQKYKMVLALPTDTDPPAAPIASWDGNIGINPPFVIIKDMPTPYDYGAIGDGVADDTIAMQAWLDAIAGSAGYLRTGTYAISSSLKINSNTTIYGAGRGSAIITLMEGFPSNSDLMHNARQSTDIIIDENILVCGVTFQGSSTAVVSNSLLNFVGVTNLTFRDCRFRHHRQIMLAMGKCFNFVMEDNEGFDWGVNTGTNIGGVVFHISSDCSNGVIRSNYIHDGQAGITCAGQNVRILNNHMYNMVEVGIFGNSDSASLLIDGNFISHVRTSATAVSSQGIEVGGNAITITNNYVFDVGGTCIEVTDADVVTISGNICRAFGQEAAFTTAAGITLLAFNSTDGTISAVNVTNNVISSVGSVVNAYGIVFSLQGSGVKMSDINCSDNQFTGAFSVATIGYYPDYNTVVGTNFMVRNNNGANDTDLSTQAINFQIPSGTTGSFDVGSVGFKSSRIEFYSVFATGTTGANASIGMQTWQTGWDIVSQVITTARAYFGSVGMAWAADGTKAHSEDTSGRSSITVVDTEGHPICVAYVSALNNDGFTVTINSSPRAEVNAGGASYSVGDTGTITGGDGLATYTVLDESGGVVTSVGVSGGSGYVNATGATTTVVTGGGNSALTLDLFSSSPTTEDVIVTAICYA